MLRRLADRSFVAFCGACALFACAILFGILGAIIFRGAPAIDFGFLTRGMSEAGGAGGVFYHVVGTAILVATAGLVAAPLAVGLALTQAVFVSRAGRARRSLELLLYVLNGVPSILFGLFGLIVFVKFFGWGKSWLAGGVLLGFMILPTLTVALIERIESLPKRYVEAAAALGLTESQIIASVILPQSLGALATGSLLGLARAAGETAPILFTATVFAGVTWPSGVRESPVLSLPYHVFVLAQDSFDPAAASKVWGATVVLLMLVLGLSLTALPLRLRLHEEARRL